MASIASKLARAAVACRAPTAAVGGCSRLVSPRLPQQLYLTAGRRMFSHFAPEDLVSVQFPTSVLYPLSEADKQALTVTEEKLKSNDAMWAMYEYWRKHYHISRDGAELKRRFEIFKETARFVYEAKKSRGEPVGMNAFSDRTLDEMIRPRPRPQAEWTEL